MIHYVSTRGASPEATFRDALLAGLAPDGGLYVPSVWPRLDPAAIEAFEGAAFADVAAEILTVFAAPWISRDEALTLAKDAYETFASPTIVAPLRVLGTDLFLLELFHGPTLAFKDVAMQLMARLFERALKETGERVVIIGATSGDTGGAAVAAFAGRSNIDLFVLYPEGRISDVQRRFMTTAEADNVRAISVAGTFDDCQSIVKALFADRAFAARRRLSGINSINWARLAIQSIYYFTAAAALRRSGDTRPPAFSVPTGNFGDAFAGYMAKRLGLACGPILCAVNSNDILHRVLTTGRYQPRRVIQTEAPSMDIEVASNFERLLFEASGRDGGAVAGLMCQLIVDGGYDLPQTWRAAMETTFLSESVSEGDRVAEMRMVFDNLGLVLDPHTAVGTAAARRFLRAQPSASPLISLATAHPAKFPDAVNHALRRPEPLPATLAKSLDRAERVLHALAGPDDVKALIDQALG